VGDESDGRVSGGRPDPGATSVGGAPQVAGVVIGRQADGVEPADGRTGEVDEQLRDPRRLPERDRRSTPGKSGVPTTVGGGSAATAVVVVVFDAGAEVVTALVGAGDVVAVVRPSPEDSQAATTNVAVTASPIPRRRTPTIFPETASTVRPSAPPAPSVADAQRGTRRSYLPQDTCRQGEENLARLVRPLGANWPP